MKWIAIDGNFDLSASTITYHGQPIEYTDTQGCKQKGFGSGLLMSDERFSGGEISAYFEFSKISDLNACEIILYFDPANRWFISAGLGGLSSLCVIRHWDGKWQVHAAAGDKKNLQMGRKYHFKAKVRGSRIALAIDDVEVLTTVLPFPLPASQTGIYCFDDSDIHISDFKVSSQHGRAFVVMQFSSPFTEIYEEVISGVCKEFGLDPHRADETYGPGLIIADMTREIAESELVISEITPPNPNVYYEIGYSHAINKPTILLADKKIEKLPFDISGFRVLFYENSINGKGKFEDGLRKHIAAILQKDTMLSRPA